MNARRATPGDAAAIARIYNEGIADRIATFETEPRTAEAVRAWFERPHPIVVIEREGSVVAFAVSQPSSPRKCYERNSEFSVYVERASRRTGAGTLAMQALIRELAALGWNKLVSHVFADNTASRRLLGKLGFREVGVLERHGNLDGEWRDVVLVELLL